MSAAKRPNISALRECVSVIIPKSWLQPSTNVLSFSFVKTQASPDFVADLLPLEAIMMSGFPWITSINDSLVFNSTAL